MSKDFTKADVDYLVSSPKCVVSIPRPKFLDPKMRTGWRIQLAVFSKSDHSKPIKGLIVIAKAHQAPIGLPRPTPSTALEWHGRRIRGLNYEMWHDNPDGSIVRGWHEHTWSSHEQDCRVIAAHPEPKRRDLMGILQWSLKRWNIEVQEEQANLDDIAD